MEIVIKWAGINYGLDFLIAFIGGGFILILFCYERFAQPVQKNESFVSTLLPAHLATKQAYLKAFLSKPFLVIASLIQPGYCIYFHL